MRRVFAKLDKNSAWVVCALSYELGYLLEPKAAPDTWQVSSDQPLAKFWRFAECEPLSAEQAEAWLSRQSGCDAAGVVGLQPGIDEAAYSATVDRVKYLISEGDCYQVNYTLPLNFEWFGSPLGLYKRLRQRQPVRYGGFVGNGQEGLVSLSPELFVERNGHRLTTRPMKGTAPRDTPAEALRASAKDQAENLMIVDLLRNDLGRLATQGSVVVDRLFDIEEYPSVWQMVSEISARVEECSFSDVLRALFPCGSITGAPKIRAMQIAAELEQAPRDIYTGALGFLKPNGDFRLNVAIRTLELALGNQGKMGVGSGVVADSQAAAEWQECLLKASFLRDCDPGLKLIETLRREDGVYPMWRGHLARLRRSAACFGFPFDEQVVFKQLAQQPVKGVWRVRLSLDKAGILEVTSAELPATPPELKQVCFSSERIDANDLLQRHKTSSRSLYDAALSRLDSASPIFDFIFLNQRGEVAEGARSNVFVEKEGVLLTPPLSSGALPGVLRAALLENGRAKEAVLWPEDLAGQFFVGNALRGLMPVRLQSD